MSHPDTSASVTVRAVAVLLPFLVGCLLEADDWPTVKEGIRRRHPSVASLTPDRLATWTAGDTVQPLLLDVRSTEEYAVSHLAGARRAASLDEALQLLADARRDTPIVTYCAVGYRSGRLADQLRLRGYTGVVNLEGSLFQWANEGRPLWRDGESVDVVHPYGEPWAGLLDEARRAR